MSVQAIGTGEQYIRKKYLCRVFHIKEALAHIGRAQAAMKSVANFHL